MDENVNDSLRLLINNLRSIEVPLSLISQFFPEQYKKVRMKLLRNDPESFIKDRIKGILESYSYAVGNRDETNQKFI